MNGPSSRTSGPSPLNEEQRREIEEAIAGFRKISGAQRYALVNGVTLMTFGALTLLFSIGEVAGMSLGALLCTAATIELVQRRALSRLEVRAPRFLAMNQLFIGAIVVGWCVYRYLTVDAGEFTSAAGGTEELGVDLGEIAELAVGLTKWAYVAIGGVTALFQALMWLYYNSKQRVVQECAQRTPDWVLDLKSRGLLRDR